MADSIEILNDLDEVIRRKQEEIRERKQKKAEAEKLANDGSDRSTEHEIVFANAETNSSARIVNSPVAASVPIHIGSRSGR